MRFIASIYFAVIVMLAVSATYLYAQQPTAPTAPPEQDELFWCKQQRNFFADNSAAINGAAAKLDKEVTRLKAEIEELKKKLPPEPAK